MYSIVNAPFVGIVKVIPFRFADKLSMEFDMGQGKYHIKSWFLLSVILSLMIQIIGIISQDPLRVRDGKEYLSISGNVYAGNGFAVDGNLFDDFRPYNGEKPTRMRQPIYPIFLVIFYWFLGEKSLLSLV